MLIMEKKSVNSIIKMPAYFQKVKLQEEDISKIISLFYTLPFYISLKSILIEGNVNGAAKIEIEKSVKDLESVIAFYLEQEYKDLAFLVIQLADKLKDKKLSEQEKEPYRLALARIISASKYLVAKKNSDGSFYKLLNQLIQKNEIPNICGFLRDAYENPNFSLLKNEYIESWEYEFDKKQKLNKEQITFIK